jgi:PKD repeat protein
MKKKIALFGILFLSVQLLFSQTTYYSKPSGNLNIVGTWGTNADGTGTAPVNFTTAGCTYIIVNNASPTIAANWTISGAGSVLEVGDGTQTISFSVPSPRTLVATINVMSNSTLTSISGSTISGCTIGVANNAFLIIQSAANPTLGTLTSGSTVTYSRAAAQTVVNAAYYNLTLGGTGNKTLANTTNTSIANVLTIGTGLAFVLNSNNTLALTLYGTLTSAGTITGGANSNLTIGGSGALGTIIPTAAPLTLHTLIVNRSGTVTLGGNITVATTGTITNGILDLNGHTLILNGTLTLPASSSNGTITGSSTSNLSIGATGITNDLYFTSGSQTLNNFTLNSSGVTLKFGSDLTVSGAYTHTKGIVDINGNTLSLTGTATFASTVANGTTSGSSTSSLLISATTITNSFFMTVGAQILNNLSLNSSGQTLTLGSAVTVSGAYTQTNGIVKLNGQVLTLNGTATFPAASANGTITGSNTSDLSISATSVTNTLFFTTGALSLRNFTVNCSGQTVKLGTALTIATGFTHTAGILDLNGQTLTLNGTISFPSSASNGSFSGSTASSLSIGGAGAYTNSMYMTQSGTANYLNNITLNRSSQTLTLGNTLNLYGALTPTAGNFASAGNLVLIASSYSVTGRIATIGASGSVTGNVTVQAYAKGGTTGWTTMGAAGISGRTFVDWNDDFSITCLNCPDGYMSSFGSVQWYDETVGGLESNASRFKEISNTTDALTIGKGFWVYLGNGTNTTTDIIMDVTGPVNQGNFAFNLTRTNIGGGTNATDHGYNLIANPYPSPISWSLLRAGGGSPNVANAIYVYNPDLSGYASCVGGVSSPAVGSGGIGNNIPAGQAFYVKANAAAITMTAKETNKGASTQELLKMSNQQVTSTGGPMVLRLQASGLAMQFETALYFDANATMAYEDEYDAAYIGVDAGHLGIATSLAGTDYAINGLPALTTNYSIPVKVTTGTTGTYQIAAADFQNLPSGTCIFLHDNYTGANQDLRSGSYSCNISDTETVARFVLNLNINNNLSVISNIKNPSCSSTANGSIIALATGSLGPWNYYWKDAGNNIIKTSLNKLTADTLLNITGGNYGVDVNTAGTCDNGTQSFILQGISAAGSSFNPSFSSVILLQDTVSVPFTNTSSNANTYWWDFGDGNGSSDTNAVSYYGSPGVYTVTLTAYNALCGDSAISTQVITVLDSASLAGIVTQAAVTGKKMFIAKDAAGYFVQFNYNTKTNAVISVENVLGEKVVSDLHEKNVLDGKVYIPLGNTENKILILSVVTEAGEKTFSKIINY